MSPEPKITTEQTPGKDPVTILHLHGGLDLKSEALLFDDANTAYKQGARRLVIDLAEVDRITSAGMRALTKVYNLFTPEAERGKGAYVRMCGGKEHVTDVLDMTGFLKRIPHHKTEPDALEAFHAPMPPVQEP